MPSPLKAMVDWPTPKSIKEVSGFLGLTGWYRVFIVGYAKISSPLMGTLKKIVIFI